jgi:hypothetical protein
VDFFWQISNIPFDNYFLNGCANLLNALALFLFDFYQLVLMLTLLIY